MNDKKLKNFNPMALREKYSAKSMSNKNNYSSFGWTMVGITTPQSLMTNQ